MKLARKFGSLRFIRPGVRHRIVEALFPESKSPDLEFTVPFRGLAYRGNLRNSLDYTVYYYGAYEEQELDVLTMIASRVDQCVSFDVGCNTGHHLLVLAAHSSKVYAFEPLSLVREVAIARITENSLNNVEFLPFGLGDENASRDFYFNQESQNQGTGSFRRDHDPSAKFYDKLQLRIGDDWVEENGITRVDLIKIDVEGLEASVLSGMQRTIATCKPVIQFEISPLSYREFQKRGGVNTILNTLLGGGYDLYEIVRGKKRFVFFYDPSVYLKVVDKLAERTYTYNILAVPRRLAKVISQFELRQ
jgi:FkbM family methyltransferase